MVAEGDRRINNQYFGLSKDQMQNLVQYIRLLNIWLCSSGLLDLHIDINPDG